MSEPLNAGLHFDVPAAIYHSDPAPEPSLSSSIAKVLLDQSPRHAWLQHPRLNVDMQAESDPTRAKEIGTAVHKLTLGRGGEIIVIDAADFKGGAAKAARAAAYQAGACPILKPDHEQAQAIALAVCEQIAQIHDCHGFNDAASEVVGISHDPTGAWLRCMMDKFEERDGGAIIWDVKSGDQSAEPSTIGRRIANMGYELQAALYERLVSTIRPDLAGRLRFRWVFVENEAPHLITVAELDNAGLEIGRKKVAAALSLWNRCRSENDWPGYPAAVVIAEYPSFAESAWLAREIADESIRDNGLDPFLMRAPWRPMSKPREMLETIAP